MRPASPRFLCISSKKETERRDFKVEQKTITRKEQKAPDKVKQADTALVKIRRDQNKELRKEPDRTACACIEENCVVVI